MLKGTREQGFTVLEMIVVLGITATIGAIGVSQFRAADNLLFMNSNQVSATLKLGRSRAISTTSPYILKAISESEIQGYRVETCNDSNGVADPQVKLTLPNRLRMPDTNWEVCFTSRGFTNVNETFSIIDNLTNTSMQVEIMLGGSVRTY